MMSDSITTIDQLPELALPEEVARLLRCSARYIKNECTAGRLSAALVAGKYLIERDAVREYLVRCRKPTEDRTCIGATTATNGSFVGSNLDASTRKLLAQEEIRNRRQSRRLQGSSSKDKKDRSGQVIPLRG